MSTWQWVAVGAAALALFWLLGAHNRLMALRTAIQTAWGQLEGVLSQRSADIARLIHALRPHLTHEHATLDALLVANTQVDDAAGDMKPRPYAQSAVQRLTEAEAGLSGSLSRTLALVEQRPELFTYPELQPLVRGLRQGEPQVVFGRQLFNQASSAYTVAAQQWPTRWVVGLLGFKPAGTL